MDLMKKHLDIFNNFKSEENQDLFKAHLLVLHDLYRINIMKSQLSSEQLDLRAVLTNAIQVAIPHWMLILSANFMPANSVISLI
jgi:BAI1-associated protein 3